MNLTAYLACVQMYTDAPKIIDYSDTEKTKINEDNFRNE